MSLGSSEPSASRGSIEDLWQRRTRKSTSNSGTTGRLERTEEEGAEEDDEEEGEEVLSGHSPAVVPEAKEGAQTTSEAKGWHGTAKHPVGQDSRWGNQGTPAAHAANDGGTNTGGSSLLCPPQGGSLDQKSRRTPRPPSSPQQQQQQRGVVETQGPGRTSAGVTRGRDPWMDSMLQGQVQEWQRKGTDCRPELATGQGLGKPLCAKGHPGAVQPRACEPGPRTASSAATVPSGSAHDRTHGALDSTAALPTPHQEHEARVAPSSTPSTTMGALSSVFSPTSAASAQSIARLASVSECQPSDQRSAWGVPSKAQPPQYHRAQGAPNNKDAPTPMRLEHAFGRVAASTASTMEERSPEKFQSSSSHAQGYGAGSRLPACPTAHMEQSPGQKKLQGRWGASPLSRRQGQGHVSEFEVRREPWGSDEKENAVPSHKRLRGDLYAQSPGIAEAVLATQQHSSGAGNMGSTNPSRELETQATSTLGKRSIEQERPSHVTQAPQSSGMSLTAQPSVPASEDPASGCGTAAACIGCGAHLVTVQARSGPSSAAGIPVVSLSKKFLARLSRPQAPSNTPGHCSIAGTARAPASRPPGPGNAPFATPAAKPGVVRVRAVDAALCSWGSGAGGVEMGEEVWVKEDGCVFSPIFCKGCQTQHQPSHQALGVLVLAANTSNRHINGKVRS